MFTHFEVIFSNYQVIDDIEVILSDFKAYIYICERQSRSIKQKQYKEERYTLNVFLSWFEIVIVNLWMSDHFSFIVRATTEAGYPLSFLKIYPILSDWIGSKAVQSAGNSVRGRVRVRAPLSQFDH